MVVTMIWRRERYISGFDGCFVIHAIAQRDNRVVTHWPQPRLRHNAFWGRFQLTLKKQWHLVGVSTLVKHGNTGGLLWYNIFMITMLGLFCILLGFCNIHINYRLRDDTSLIKRPHIIWELTEIMVLTVSEAGFTLVKLHDSLRNKLDLEATFVWMGILADNPCDFSFWLLLGPPYLLSMKVRDTGLMAWVGLVIFSLQSSHE